MQFSDTTRGAEGLGRPSSRSPSWSGRVPLTLTLLGARARTATQPRHRTGNEAPRPRARPCGRYARKQHVESRIAGDLDPRLVVGVSVFGYRDSVHAGVQARG